MNHSPDSVAAATSPDSSDASPRVADRLLGGVLLTALALIVAFGVLWFIPLETPATAHPLHPSLRVRPQSPDSTLGLWSLGLAIALLTVILLALLGLAGVRRHGRYGSAGRWVAGLFAAYGVVLVALMGTYLRAPQPPTDDFILGLPLSSLILLVGVWHFPLAIVAMLVWRYHEWTLTDHDLERFRALAARASNKDTA